MSAMNSPQQIAQTLSVTVVNPLYVAKRFHQSDTMNFWKAPMVTYETVKKMSQQPSPNSYLVDVREPDEVAQGSIPSSVSIPLSGLGHSLSLPDIEFEDKHGFKKPAKNQEIVVYCRSGKRSATSSDEFKERGYTNVKNYSGSWLDWVAQEQERQKKNNWDDD
ncbi:hypothetical protein FRB94_005650 [Tulasnella sp. JGI-2019a]|nr:hypothetical protein FRB94_005650 [Tulasnella sp. JGI-2019a]